MNASRLGLKDPTRPGGVTGGSCCAWMSKTTWVVYLLACDVQVMETTWWSMVRGEGQARCAMPRDCEAVKDGQRAWTEGPEETMRGHG